MAGVSGAGLGLAALFGLVFGSLAGALSYRLPRGLPIGMDRSRCPNCQAVLGLPDLLPILSWLFFRGHCRHCGGAVSWRYPVIEAATALLFVASFCQAGGDPLAAAPLALICFALVVIIVADFEEQIIPDAMLLLLLPLALYWRWTVDGDWLDAALGCVTGGAASYGLRWAFLRWRGKDGLGLGDVKFLGVAGLIVGLSGLGGYLMTSGLTGIALGLIWRFAGRGPIFPFGPALCLALLFAVFFPGSFAEILLW
jgi:prepilin signal peptidase PulO-like enzyme (type II secretory pathway)